MYPSSKASLANLKKFIKENTLSPTSGTKVFLLHRIELFRKCNELSLKVLVGDDMVSPCSLKTGALKRACAQHSLNIVDDSYDELLQTLINFLEETSSSSSSIPNPSSSNPDPSSSSSSSANPSITLAKRILALQTNSIPSPILVLNLLDPSLTPSSPSSSLRRAYLKASLAIHPDRISNVFPEATRAFQVLVTAYERLTQPENFPTETEEENKKSKKTTKIQRSNEGCFVTAVHCPRCKQKWNQKLDGNPDYVYNIMMSGLKSFSCSTCLMTFGCMSAVHKCKFCNVVYDYSPGDFHRRIQCPNEKCGKKFGFFEFHMSDRAMKDLRVEVKASRESYNKTASGIKRRMESAERRGEASAFGSSVDKELAFKFGLCDECPRCGLFLGKGSEVNAEQHLSNCEDVDLHVANAKRKSIATSKAKSKAKVATAQADAEALASFKFLGGDNNLLYLLNEGQLEKEAEERGLGGGGKKRSKSELISSIVSSSQLVVGSSSSSSSSSSTRNLVENLPTMAAMQSMSAEELVCVCASAGITTCNENESYTKSDILNMIEKEMFAQSDSAHDNKLLLADITDEDDAGPQKKKKKKVDYYIDLDSSEEE